MRTAVRRGAAEAPSDVPAFELARVDAWLRAVAARAARLEDRGIGHVVVTPLGMPDRVRLRSALGDAGVALRGRTPIPAWAAASTALYVRRADPAALARAVRFERAWEALFPGGVAEAWAVEPASLPLLVAVKHELRAGLRHVRLPLGSDRRGAVLHPFHVADPDDRAVEARRLLAAVSLVSETPTRAARS